MPAKVMTSSGAQDPMSTRSTATRSTASTIRRAAAKPEVATTRAAPTRRVAVSAKAVAEVEASSSSASSSSTSTIRMASSTATTRSTTSTTKTTASIRSTKPAVRVVSASTAPKSAVPTTSKPPASTASRKASSFHPSAPTTASSSKPTSSIPSRITATKTAPAATAAFPRRPIQTSSRSRNEAPVSSKANSTKADVQDLPDLHSAMEAVSLSAPTVDTEADAEILKLCARLSTTVQVLDEVLASKAESSSAQEKLDVGIKLIRTLASWPTDISASVEYKLYRVLDRIHRRACTKLSSQGSNSQGKPKSVDPSPINLQDVARACLDLFESLYDQPSRANPSSKPAEALPDQAGQLTDIVYGRRVLANALFSISSPSACEAAFGELLKCFSLFSRANTKELKPALLSEQLRLLSSSAHNPAGILYNAARYRDALPFLNLAAECDQLSVRYLKAHYKSNPEALIEEKKAEMDKRADVITKKLEYIAVAHRFAAEKGQALNAYRDVLMSLSESTQAKIAKGASRVSMDALFKSADSKTLAATVKAVVDISVFELSNDLDPSDTPNSLTGWLLSSDCGFTACVKGAILEQAATLLEARAHLRGANTALTNVHKALLSIYTPKEHPLRRARVLLKQLETDVLSQRLALSEEDVVTLERDALECLDAGNLARDQGLQRFQPQYKCALLLVSALGERLRHPYHDPRNVVQKVDAACKIVATCWRSETSTTPMKSPSAALATKTANIRRSPATTTTPASRQALSKRGAPPQSTTTTKSTHPVTPPSKTNKPAFSAIMTPVKSPLHASSSSNKLIGVFDRPDQFCRLLETLQSAFSALSLTHCSVELLKILRNVAKRAMTPEDGCDVYCRASAELAKTYLTLGKRTRAISILNQATAVYSRPTKADTERPPLVSQDARFRCLMVGTELLAQEGGTELGAAEQRFSEGLAVAQNSSSHSSKAGKDAPSSSMLEKLAIRQRQCTAFLVCSTLQEAKGDLAGALNSTTSAIRQSIRLLGNLTHISKRAQESQEEVEQEAVSLRERNVDGLPSSELSDSTTSSQQHLSNAKKQGSAAEATEEEAKPLPRFSSTTFTLFFWRSVQLLISAYLRLSQLHGIRGSGVDAEAFASECVDFTSSMKLALPLAQALVQRGEVRLQLNRTDLGQEDLSRCLEVLQETWIPEVITLTCIQGDCLTRIMQLGEALRSYSAGEATLRTLSSAFVDLEATLATPKTSDRVQRGSLTSSSPGATARKSGLSPNVADFILPDMQGKLLRRQGWILQLMGQNQEGEEVVERALSIKEGLHSVEARMDQYVLEGRIALRRSLEHLKGDRFLSMLPEAAISIPMVPSTSVRTLATVSSGAGGNSGVSSDAVKAALSMLTPADAAFKEALAVGARTSHSLQLREAYASLAQVYTTQAALGRNVRMAAQNAAGLLDLASSVGVRRNLLVSISNKQRKDVAAAEAPDWPILSGADNQAGHEADEQDNQEMFDGLPSRLAKLKLAEHQQSASSEHETVQHPVPSYWRSVQQRHEQARFESGETSPLLPRNWTVISISVMGSEREKLVLTRQEGGGGDDECHAKEPVLYSLPLNRRSQREGGGMEEDEEEELTLQAAQEKLIEIVRSSNDGIHGVKDVQGMDARRQWWTERHRLDDELRDLLQAIQDTWIGGFKGVFAEPSCNLQAKAALRARFEKIVRRACFPTANKRPSKLKLDDAVFECFAGLPADCTDEDLEDVVHYVMDTLQFSGFQVAVDEIDLDETATDLRGALEEFRGKRTHAASPNKNANLAYLDLQEDAEERDHHIFLILDKDTAVFPWESMPILRGKAVSRIPSMLFLQDRIELAKIYHSLPGSTGDEDGVSQLQLQKGAAKSEAGASSRSKSRSPTKKTTSNSNPGDDAWKIVLRNGKLFNLSKRKTFYLLNPGGDLVQSQERFEPWLSARAKRDSWRGIVGRQPIINELPDALSTSDLMLYFGHGGAEQFIRQSRVRELQRCAVTMLWGCSSAVLQSHGEFDPTGTPLNYMCGGAPAMVGNLWDMTDRELDSVCEGVFGRLGLMQENERIEVKKAARNVKLDDQGKVKASRGAKEMSLVRAVAESRDDCKLTYLTGAATVVYGVPVYWAEDDE